jgi:ATP adenylyltransferase
MDRIWAPWRGKYIENSIKGHKVCVFCELKNKKPSKENLLIYRNEFAMIVMNKFPYNNGHILIIPVNHVASFEELSEEEFNELNKLLKKAIKAIKKAYLPEGINIGLNMGRVAGAGIDKHIHYHVVPRWNGDTNFMPVTGGTKIISEHIISSYEKIKKSLLEETK